MVLATPFETNGVVTTQANEQAFYTALEADTGHIKRWQIGTDTIGNPIWLVCITGSPPTNPEPAHGVLLVAKQHGNEVASREVAIQIIRDLAYWAGADLTYLNDYPVYVIPTVLSKNSATNQNGLNLNRDHIRLSQPETVATHEAFNMVQPTVAVDLHENNSQSTPNTELMYAAYEELTDEILASSLALAEYVGAYVAAQGLTWGWYVKTGDDPTTARNQWAMYHTTSILSETMASGVPLANRVTYATHIAKGTIQYHRLNAAALLSAQNDSIAEAIAEGANTSDTFVFDADTTLPSTPAGYLISNADFAANQEAITLHGITTWNTGSARYAPMAQSARTILPLLMDPASIYKLFTATPSAYVAPVDPDASWGASSWGPFATGSVENAVTSVSLWSGTELFPVWTAP